MQCRIFQLQFTSMTDSLKKKMMWHSHKHICSLISKHAIYLYRCSKMIRHLNHLTGRLRKWKHNFVLMKHSIYFLLLNRNPQEKPAKSIDNTKKLQNFKGIYDSVWEKERTPASWKRKRIKHLKKSRVISLGLTLYWNVFTYVSFPFT